MPDAGILGYFLAGVEKEVEKDSEGNMSTRSCSTMNDWRSAILEARKAENLEQREKCEKQKLQVTVQENLLVS